MQAALDLAAAGKKPFPQPSARKRFATDEELYELLGQRMNQKRYHPGQDMVKSKFSRSRHERTEQDHRPELEEMETVGATCRRSRFWPGGQACSRMSADNLESIQEDCL